MGCIHLVEGQQLNTQHSAAQPRGSLSCSYTCMLRCVVGGHVHVCCSICAGAQCRRFDSIAVAEGARGSSIAPGAACNNAGPPGGSLCMTGSGFIVGHCQLSAACSWVRLCACRHCWMIGLCGVAGLAVVSHRGGTSHTADTRSAGGLVKFAAVACTQACRS